MSGRPGSLSVAFVLGLVVPVLAGCTTPTPDGPRLPGPSEPPVEPRIPDAVIVRIPFSSNCDLYPPDDEGLTGGNESLRGVGYATSEDVTLIRWLWAERGWEITGFKLYRYDGAVDDFDAAEAENETEVANVTDPDAFVSRLEDTDPRWPFLWGDILSEFGPASLPDSENITDVDSFHAYLKARPFVAQALADRNYPVALVLGIGFLEQGLAAGDTKTYRVTALTATNETEVGSVTLTPGGVTPLPPPDDLQCLDLGVTAESLDYRQAQDGDWGKAQRNRRFDRSVYLKWKGAGEDGSEAGVNTISGAWVVGYDVFRKTELGSEWLHLNGDLPVLPMPSRVPLNDTDPDPLANGTREEYETPPVPYSHIDFYYQDNVTKPGNYSYRVAPRDLLGIVRTLPEHAAQFSNIVNATAYDFMPPPAPRTLTTKVDHVEKFVVLSWEYDFANASDLSLFRVYRTTNHSAGPPSPTSADESKNWTLRGTTTIAGFVDAEVGVGPVYWYKVRAVDRGNNTSPAAGPVQAVVHDVEGPAPPTIVNPCPPERTVSKPSTEKGTIVKRPDTSTPSPHPDDSMPTTTTPVSDPHTGTSRTTSVGESRSHTLASLHCPPEGLPPTITGSVDAVRGWLYCRFSPDGPFVPIKEYIIDPIDDVVIFVDDVYDAPFLSTADCRSRAFDAYGNPSDPSNDTTVSIGEAYYDPPAPILTNVTTIFNGTDPEDWGAYMEWEIPDVPGFDRFVILKQDLEANETFNATSGLWELVPSTIDLSDATARDFTDWDVDHTTVYRYRVMVVLTDGKTNTSGERLFKVVVNGERPLAEMPADVSYGPELSPHLQWITAIPTSTGQGKLWPNGTWAVFRSVDAKKDYIQITPIASTGPLTPPEYFDTAAQFDNYWYVVVEFDNRTGEPVNYTMPLNLNASGAIPAPSFDWRNLTMVGKADEPSVLACNATKGDFSSGASLTFGAGFRIVDILWNNTSDVRNLRGNGWIQMTPQGGAEIFRGRVNFSGISVANTKNEVCRGSVSWDANTDLQGPVLTTKRGGFTYRVHALRLRPLFVSPNDALANVSVQLPEVSRFNMSNKEWSWIPLRHTTMASTLAFRFEKDLDKLANGTSFHACSKPVVFFPQETLPAMVIPLGTYTMTETKASMERSCLRPLDRYSGLWGPRPNWNDLARGDSNGGVLNATYDNTTATLLGASGIAGSFRTEQDVRYLASYPFGFSIDVTGPIALNLTDSRITNGTTGTGTLDLDYHQGVADAQRDSVAATFTALDVGSGGALSGNVTTRDAVSWLVPGGFTVPHGSWEFYVAPLTSPIIPARVTPAGEAVAVMWAERPGDVINVTNLGVGYPATSQPGLNRRLENHFLDWANCRGPEFTFDSAVDAYVRHGGMSHHHKAKIVGEVELLLHGYVNAYDNFEISFLDNYVYDSHITGNVTLPWPPDIYLRLINMWLIQEGKNAGCVGGGEIPAGDRDKFLAYWNVSAYFSGVEFRQPVPDYVVPVETYEIDDDGIFQVQDFEVPIWPDSRLQYFDMILWTLGFLNIPHLTPPETNVIAGINSASSFFPWGYFNSTRPLYNRTDYGYDRFVFLLESIRLSDPKENPEWDATATIAPPEDVDWRRRGFVDLQGVVVTPFFGPASGQDGEKPRIRPLPGTDYTGLTDKFRVSRAWIAAEDVAVDYAYDLLYGLDVDQELGIMAGFADVEFTPTGTALVDLGTAVGLLPEDVQIFSGASSAPAALRMMAEAYFNETVPIPESWDDVATLAGDWAGQLGLPDASEHLAVAQQLWSTVQNFDVSETLDELQEELRGEIEDRIRDEAIDIGRDFAADTLGKLDDWGIKLDRVRGDLEMTYLGDLDFTFDRFWMQAEVTIGDPGTAAPGEAPIVGPVDGGETQPLFHADNVHFEINRWGEFNLSARNIRSRLFETITSPPSNPHADLTILINASGPRFEGGLSIYDFKFNSLRIEEGSGAIGIGNGIYYIGLEIDAVMENNPIDPGSHMGGTILLGKVDPGSQVIRDHFQDAFEKFDEVPGSSEQVLTGFYVRVYAEMPLFDFGCVFRISVGADFSVWYWSPSEGAPAYGGRMRGYVNGKVLCIFSAHGDMTIEYAAEGGQETLRGEAWAAGGFGFCDPGDWDSWDDRWWGDGWCWTGGLHAEVWYDGDWHFDYEDDYE